MTAVLFTVLFQEGKRGKEERKGGRKDGKILKQVKALFLIRAVYETVFTRMTIIIMVLKRKERKSCRK